MSENGEGAVGETVEFRTVPTPNKNDQTTEFTAVTPQAQQQKTPILERRIDRRELFGRSLKLALGGAAAAAVGKLVLDKRSEPGTAPPATQTAEAEQTQVVAVEQTEQAVESLPLIDRVNAILGLELFSPMRNEAEMRFADDVATVEDVDLGLTVCAKLESREQLLAKRAALRAEGQPGMVQLSAEQIAYCERNKIDTEIFAMCLDTYPDALKIIAKLQPDIRDDELGKTIDPEMLMINAGGMAQLVMQETTGFREIGSEKAMTQLADPDDVNALTIYCQKLREDTGLQFDENNVPGSALTSGNSTGGTIGIQFRPTNALDHYDLLKQAGEVGNIFDPTTSIKMAWVFLASQKWVEDANDYQYGYMKGDRIAMDRALRTWNDEDTEVEVILSSADNASDSGVV
jgi:hypothetical protein